VTFSTRANPRIGQGAPALTSLGAVGGPRGVGAGALRILVEFVSTYSAEAAKKLESDLARIDKAQAISDAAQTRRLQRIAQVRGRLAQSDAVIRGKLNTAQRAELKTVEALEVLRTRAGKAQATQARTLLDTTLRASGLSKSEIDLIHERLSLRAREVQLTKQQDAAEARTTQRVRERSVVETNLARVQAGRAGIGSRLGGLAVGAVGGIIGGAVVGLGFSAIQGVIDAVGEKLQDILDPARHAREAIEEVGGAIAKLAEQDKLTLSQATVQFLKSLGVEADAATVRLLSEASAQKLVADAIAARKQIAEIAAHGDAQEIENRKQLTETLLAEARARGDVIETKVSPRGAPLGTYINGIRLEDLVTQELNRTLAETEARLRAVAIAQQQLADAAALAAIQEKFLSDTLSGVFQSQFAALGDGESARTRRLQKQLDNAQAAGSGGGSGNREQLRRIAEERELIRLRQRLRLLGANINLEKYSGKFLLEAINAKIAALQREGDEQDRLNRLLDLQYRQSKTIQRQQGESIQDFLERRAQEQRAQLAEAADLERESQIASLERQRSKVEDEIALEELAEQKKAALRKDGTSNYISNLQKQLAASQKADRERLQQQTTALQKQQNTVLYYTDQTNLQQIRQAARAAKTIQDIYALSGEVQGLQATKTFLEALLRSGVLSPAQAAAINKILTDINQTLNAVNYKSNQIQYGYQTATNIQKAENNGFGYAEGGVLELTNARSPFGQNIRTGEQGTELGVILSNKVAQALRQKYSSPDVDINLYAQQPDWMYIAHMVKNTVREVLREELH